MFMPKKFYAVSAGRQTGIFDNWDDCKAQVMGYKNAVYKSFSSKENAEVFLQTDAKSGDKDTTGEIPFSAQDSRALFDGIEGPVAYVDGSYDKTSGQYAYGVVILENPKDLGHEIHLSGKGSDPSIADMNNVAGEISGSMAAMSYARDHGYEKLTIFHDYNGISKWCVPDPDTGRTWKTNMLGTQRYKEFYDDVSQSVDIAFVKVKGHSGDYYNDIVDGLAKHELGVSVAKHVADKLQAVSIKERGHEFDDMVVADVSKVTGDYSMI